MPDLIVSACQPFMQRPVFTGLNFYHAALGSINHSGPAITSVPNYRQPIPYRSQNDTLYFGAGRAATYTDPLTKALDDNLQFLINGFESYRSDRPADQQYPAGNPVQLMGRDLNPVTNSILGEHPLIQTRFALVHYFFGDRDAARIAAEELLARSKQERATTDPQAHAELSPVLKLICEQIDQDQIVTAEQLRPEDFSVWIDKEYATNRNLLYCYLACLEGGQPGNQDEGIAQLQLNYQKAISHNLNGRRTPAQVAEAVSSMMGHLPENLRLLPPATPLQLALDVKTEVRPTGSRRPGNSVKALKWNESWYYVKAHSRAYLVLFRQVPESDQNHAYPNIIRSVPNLEIGRAHV